MWFRNELSSLAEVSLYLLHFIRGYHSYTCQPLSDHLQAIKIHKIKITIARIFLYGYTETSISQPFHNLQIIILVHCPPRGQKFMMNYDLIIKKQRKHHFHIGLNLMCFFLGMSDIFETQCKDWTFVSTSQSHHHWRCSLKSFHQHLHCRQALYWHQLDSVSDLQSAGRAQIWLQHDACQNFQCESHDTWFLKFQFPPLLHEWSKNEWNLSPSELFGRFLHFFMLMVVLNVHCPQLKFGPL